MTDFLKTRRIFITADKVYQLRDSENGADKVCQSTEEILLPTLNTVEGVGNKLLAQQDELNESSVEHVESGALPNSELSGLREEMRWRASLAL